MESVKLHSVRKPLLGFNAEYCTVKSPQGKEVELVG